MTTDGGLKNVIVIKQGDGVHEEYVQQIAKEAKNSNLQVAVIKDRLAHHCEINGIDPYKIGNDRDGWYLEKVLKIWINTFEKIGINLEVVSEDVNLKQLLGKMVVCDHHNHQLSEKLHKLFKEGKLVYKSAYHTGKFTEYTVLEDIPVLLSY